MRRPGKQWRTAAAICVAAVSTIPPQSAQPATRDSSSVKRIFVFGDSLSEGFLLKRGEAWPMLLLAKLRDADLDYEIVNASQSGGTTSGGLARLPPHLKCRIDIFILELGINDAFQGVPVDQIQRNLQSIIDRVRTANPNVQIVITGMQLPDYTADDYVGAFGSMYAALAAKNHAALVPYLLEGVGGNPALNLADRIHPNATGHKILAENVWSVLEPIARQVAEKSVRAGATRER
jgi:acyl-CoA thioesterase I